MVGIATGPIGAAVTLTAGILASIPGSWVGKHLGGWVGAGVRGAIGAAVGLFTRIEPEPR